MRDGFIKTAAASINLKVADTKYNTEEIKKLIDYADKEKINLLVMPELCITGYTCGDLLFSTTLLQGAMEGLTELCRFSKGKYPVFVVGLPISYNNKLYNCAAVISNGKILGIIPKTNLPNYGEQNEKRYFASFESLTDTLLVVDGQEVPFGNNLVFYHKDYDKYTFGVEICEDLLGTNPHSERLCKAGAAVVLNPSASNEISGKDQYRRLIMQSTSARLLCGYVYANAGYTESTQDVVYSGHHLIAENGTILAENKPFYEAVPTTEIDVEYLAAERLKNTSFETETNEACRYIAFDQKIINTKLTREIKKLPFVPADEHLAERAEQILQIQSHGLAKRLEHTKAKTCVIGVSGGSDSTLAILVAARAMDIIKRPRTDIVAITMPCFGTTKRTKSNSEKLCDALGVSFKEINITKSVNQHFEDIGQDKNCYDVTFENSQARERTQVLMDYANKTGGMVLGTGDLSELALGWATYNGDHMSMYGVNSSVPKTLIKTLIKYEASVATKNLTEVLTDILDTPVSPELLPVDEKGNISQITEDLVGPYELHDFFLYHMIRRGSGPAKIYNLAVAAFGEDYTAETIRHWLKTFIRRFFTQQFKRSCVPDGPKVCSVSLSPRGDWQMPSDACGKIWLEEVDNL